MVSRKTAPSKRRRLAGIATALVLGLAAASPVQAKDTFRLAWSIYVGWMPWAYADEKGIIDKWADKYDIDIEVVQVNSYIESINQYTGGKFDACTMTNMDALTIPAAGGVDSTAFLVGDYSDGNDGIVLKDKDSLEAIEGMDVHLVELSVSHYLLARALDTVGMSERDVNVVNTSDADMVGAYESRDVKAVVTWNPQLAQIMKKDASNLVFDSSQTPGEIVDMTVIKTEIADKHPEFAKALAGAWYETMARMQGEGASRKEVMTFLGEAAGTDRPGYLHQLNSTEMFYEPSEGVEFTESGQLVETMDLVRNFSFKHGLLGPAAPSPDVIGIEFPSGKVLGDEGNVNLRFSSKYMQMAADGEL